GAVAQARSHQTREGGVVARATPGDDRHLALDGRVDRHHRGRVRHSAEVARIGCRKALEEVVLEAHLAIVDPGHASTSCASPSNSIMRSRTSASEAWTLSASATASGARGYAGSGTASTARPAPAAAR